MAGGSRVVKVGSLAELHEAIERDLTQLIEQRLVRAARKVATVARGRALWNAPHAFGALRDSIVEINTPDGGTVRAAAAHAMAVEVGSRPHMPPVDAIEAWVKLRGMQGLTEKHPTGAMHAMRNAIRAHSTRRVTPIDAPRRIAWAIAMRIKAEGTKPTYFMRETAESLGPVLDAFVTEELSR